MLKLRWSGAVGVAEIAEGLRLEAEVWRFEETAKVCVLLVVGGRTCGAWVLRAGRC